MVDNDETIGMDSGSMDEQSAEPESHPMDAFLEGEAYELETPKRGETRTGTIKGFSFFDYMISLMFSK